MIIDPLGRLHIGDYMLVYQPIKKPHETRNHDAVWAKRIGTFMLFYYGAALEGKWASR